jgi:hypothetical protein
MSLLIDDRPDDTYDDLGLLERMSWEQIPACDRPGNTGRLVFGLPVACPLCAGDVRLVNTTASDVLAVAIVACRPCRREFEITARIVEHRRIPYKELG